MFIITQSLYKLSASRFAKILNTAKIMSPQEVCCSLVHLERKFTVKPSQPSPQPTQLCRLCPSDLQMLKCNYIQKGLLYDVHLTEKQEFKALLELMRQSLSETLCSFYPLAGRFYTDNDGCVHIDCNDEGADFIEAYAPSVSLHTLTEAEVGVAVRQLFALDGAINTHGHTLPLLLVQVTQLKDGIAVGFTVNHSVVDGTSLWHFINSWAHVCRGISKLSHIPIHTRSFDLDGMPPIPLNLPKPPMLAATYNAPPLREKIFHFTWQTISELKRLANKTKTTEHITISSFQALSAHIWQSITRARQLPKDTPTTFKLAINCRGRVIPQLPYGYFGNAIQIKSITVAASEIESADMGHVAELINSIIAGHREKQMRSDMESFHANPVLCNLDSNLRDNIVMMGSSPRFPMYDNDFGWGRPLAVRSGWANKFDGKLSSYPANDAFPVGSVDIEMCLDPLTMSALESDPFFLAFNKLARE